MKKFISTISFFFTFPIRLLRKTKIDNFVGGLIFGAIFSLVVNVVTVQIQEIIKKQRVLEALENEIVTNKLKADNIATRNNQAIETKAVPNYFFTISPYYSDIWKESSESLQYIAQLDQDIQIAVTNYYTITIRGTNEMLDKLTKLADIKLSSCYLELEKMTTEEQDKCNEWNASILNLEAKSAIDISDNSFKVLKQFHPTRDRLNNPFLRIMMGEKAMRILSGE